MPRIEEVASSRARMKVASMISVRPRTLGELAESTGISVQAVLKHIAKLRKMGLITEGEVREGESLKFRKLYSIRERRVSDFTDGNLLVAHISGEPVQEEPKAENAYKQLEALAEDLILARRRIRDMIRRVERDVDEFASTNGRLSLLVRASGLDAEEQQIASIFFTEDGMEAAKMVLSRYFGSPNPGTAIRNMLEKIGGR